MNPSKARRGGVGCVTPRRRTRAKRDAVGWDPVGFAQRAGRSRDLPAERSEDKRWGGTRWALPSGRGGRVTSPLSEAKTNGVHMADAAARRVVQVLRPDHGRLRLRALV